MKDEITLSDKHGVNPSLVLCFFCEKPKEIALFGRLENDAEAPREITLDYEPCDKCQEKMNRGITLIEVTPEFPPDRRPSCGVDNDVPVYPTGRWCVVSEEGVRRLVNPADLAEEIIKKRKALIDPEVFDLLMKVFDQKEGT